MFRLLLRIEMVEVAIELIKAVIGRQMFIPVTEMILAELTRSVTLRLEQLRNRHITFLQTKGRAWHAHFGVARP